MKNRRAQRRRPAGPRSAPPRRRLRLPHLSSRTATTTCSLFAARGSPCV